MKQLDSIDYEEKDDDEKEFYKLLAHSPYRRLMVLEAFCYKSLLESKHVGEDDIEAGDSFDTLIHLLDIIENIGAFGVHESNVFIDYIEADILKYYYSLLLTKSKTEHEFVFTVNRIRAHIFQADLCYHYDLRKYLFELVANHEIQYYNQGND